MEYVALLTFKGVVIEKLAIPESWNVVELYVQEYGFMPALVSKIKPTDARKMALYKMVFEFKRTIHVDPCNRVTYNEYEFAGIRPSGKT